MKLDGPKRFVKADSTSYLLALGDERHRWIEDFIGHGGVPGVADLAKICLQRNWSFHIVSHAASQYVLLHTFDERAEIRLEHAWGDQDSAIEIPEHAMLILMSRAHHKD